MFKVGRVGRDAARPSVMRVAYVKRGRPSLASYTGSPKYTRLHSFVVVNVRQNSWHMLVLVHRTVFISLDVRDFAKKFNLLGFEPVLSYFFFRRVRHCRRFPLQTPRQ